MDSPYWSKDFRLWIRALVFENVSASICLATQLEDLTSIEVQKKRIEKQLVHLSEIRYKEFVVSCIAFQVLGCRGLDADH